MKQTAVEWLVEQLTINNYLSDNAHWLIDDAKEMEKQQIIEAHGKKTKNSSGISNYTYILSGEEYYKETFLQ
jgi:hypothetical protein